MFITELIVKDRVVLNYIILRGVSILILPICIHERQNIRNNFEYNAAYAQYYN